MFFDNDEPMLVVLDIDGTPRPWLSPGGFFVVDGNL